MSTGNKIADVLVPANNEEGMIGKTLRSIASQKLDPSWRFQVHVIANGCTDDTIDAAKQAIADIGSHKQIGFIVHTLSVANKVKALQYGLERADAPFVICIDADSMLSTSCFWNTLAAFADPKIMVAGPLPQVVMSRENCINMLGFMQRTANICKRIYECTTPAGCMIAYRRELIDTYPDHIAGDDTWVTFIAAERYGWQSVRVVKKSTVFVVGPQHWFDYIKQDSRFTRVTQQLLERFPELTAVRNSEKKLVQKLARLNMARVKAALQKEGIPIACLAYRRFWQKICSENANMVADQLIGLDGRWEVISTTKHTPLEVC